MLRARQRLLPAAALLVVSLVPAGVSRAQDVTALEREFYALDFKVRQWERLQRENPKIVVPPGFEDEVARYQQLAAQLHVARTEQAVRIAEQERARAAAAAADESRGTVDKAVDLLDTQIEKLLAENALLEKLYEKKLATAQDATAEVVQRFARAWEPERKATSLQEVKDIFVAHQRQIQGRLAEFQARRTALAGAKAALAAPSLAGAVGQGDFFGAAEKAIDTGSAAAETVYDEETFKAVSARLGAGKSSLSALKKALAGDYVGSAISGLDAVDALVADVSADLAKESGTLKLLLESDFQDPALSESAQQVLLVANERKLKLESVDRLKRGIGSARSILKGGQQAYAWFTQIQSEIDAYRALAAVPGRSGETTRLIAGMSALGRLFQAGGEYLPPGLSEAVGPMLDFYGQALQLGDTVDRMIRDIYARRGDCLNIQGGLQFDPKAVQTIESRWPRPDLCLKLAEGFQAAGLPIYVDDPDSRRHIEPPYFFIPDTGGEPTALTSAEYARLQQVAAAFGAYTTILQEGYALTADDLGAIIRAIQTGGDEFSVDEGLFSGTRYRISELEEDARILLRLREAVGERLTPGTARGLIADWKAFESEVGFAGRLCAFQLFKNDQDQNRIFVMYLDNRDAFLDFVVRRRLLDPDSRCRAQVAIRGPEVVTQGERVQFTGEPGAHLEDATALRFEWKAAAATPAALDGPQVELSFEAPGRQRLTLKLSGRIGAREWALAEASRDVDVLAAGRAEVEVSIVGPVEVGSGAPVVLRAQATGNSSRARQQVASARFEWRLQGRKLGTGSLLSFEPPAPGSHAIEVVLLGGDEAGRTVMLGSTEHVVTVSERRSPAQVVLRVTGPSRVRVGEPASLAATPVVRDSADAPLLERSIVEWSAGGQVLETDRVLLLDTSRPGDYELSITLLREIGGRDVALARATHRIRVVEEPEPVAAPEAPSAAASPAAPPAKPAEPAMAPSPGTTAEPSPAPETPGPAVSAPPAPEPERPTAPPASPAPAPAAQPVRPGSRPTGSSGAAPPAPAGGAAASPAGAAAARSGVWTLVNVTDSQSACEDWEEGGVGDVGEGATGHRVGVSGASITTSFTDVATGKVVRSGSSWTEFPKVVPIPGREPGIEIRVESDAPPSRGGALVPDSCSGPPRTVLSPGAVTVTHWTAWNGLVNTLGFGSRAGERKTISLTHYGGGGSGTRTYTYEWSGGAAPAVAAGPAAGLKVEIAADKLVLGVGETTTLRAKVGGGTPPFRYAWAGALTGSADKLAFAPAQKGTHSFRLTVTDAKGATATAAASLVAEPLVVSLRMVSPQGGRLLLGQPARFAAAVTAGGKPVSGTFTYRWQPHPAVQFEPYEGSGPESTARFPRPERVAVWVEVLRAEGQRLATLGESAQLQVDVGLPQLSLRAEPSAPYPGQEVRVSVSEQPSLASGIASYWWEVQGNARNAGALADDRQYSFRPADATPIVVTVHGKARDGGADLGQQSLTITPRRYDVRVSGPQSLGPRPQVWDPATGGLREAAQGIAVFQDMTVRAEVSPPAAGARYAWSVSPSGCTVSNEISQEPRVNCSQAGSYTATVVVRDAEGAELGSGATSISVLAPPSPIPTASAAPGDTDRNEERARLLRAEGQAHESAGRLREAVARYKESLALEPNPGLADYVRQLEQRLVAEELGRERARQLRAEGEALQNAGKLREAVQRYRESLRYFRDERLEAYIRRVEAEIARQDQAREAAQRLRAEGEALQKAGRLREAADRYHESLRYLPDERLEAYIRQLEGEIARQDQARETARRLRAEGESLQNAGRLREALERYRESLRYLADERLEAHIRQLEAEVARQRQAAEAEAARQRQVAAAEAARREQQRQTPSDPATPAPAPARGAATPGQGPRSTTSGPEIDPKKREKALKLRAEGEREEAKDKLKNAVEKYDKSLQILADGDLERHVAALRPRAEQQEREKKAKRHADLGAVQEKLGLLSSAIDEYRKSLEYVQDTGIAQHIRSLEERLARERRAEQERAREEQRRGGSAAGGSSSSSSSTSSSSAGSRSAPATSSRPASGSAPASRPAAPAVCSVSGTYSASLEGETARFSLSQSGDHISGSVSGGGVSGSIEASRSGQTLRFRNEAGDTWTGTVASDCSSISMTMNVDGETISLTVRR